MKEEQLSHLSNLIALAHADGRLDINEKNLLIRIGMRMGLTENEILDKIDRPGDISFYCPEKETERYHQLYELVEMMTVDGHIHDNEVLLLKNYASKLKFESEIIDPLIEKIKEYLSLGYDQNKMQTDLNDLINKI